MAALCLPPFFNDTIAKIEAIDLTNIKLRLQKNNGWSVEKCNAVERRYKNFLKLIGAGMRVVPTLQLDSMWHEHILFTQQYTDDCLRCFGRYIHHNPTVPKEGSGGLDDTFQKTCRAYKKMFGEKYDQAYKD